MSFQFIHIPKCAGNYIYKLFNKQWIGHVPMVHSQQITMTIIRHPIEFYKSLYYFLKDSSKNILNYQKYIARNESLNSFIRLVCNGTRLKDYCKLHNLTVNTPYDQFHIDANNDYGLFTNYVAYLLNPNQYKSIDSILDYISTNVEILKFENLERDLDQFISKTNSSYNKDCKGKVFNASDKPELMEELEEDTIQLIETCEDNIIKRFY